MPRVVTGASQTRRAERSVGCSAKTFFDRESDAGRAKGCISPFFRHTFRGSDSDRPSAPQNCVAAREPDSELQVRARVQNDSKSPKITFLSWNMTVPAFCDFRFSCFFQCFAASSPALVTLTFSHPHPTPSEEVLLVDCYQRRRLASLVHKRRVFFLRWITTS